MLLKVLKEDLNKWKSVSYSWLRLFNSLGSFSFKFIHKFKASSIKKQLQENSYKEDDLPVIKNFRSLG